MKSKITNGETKKIFTKKFLNKHEVSFFECVDTGFIQTEDAFWLDEAYSEAITKLDVGLVQRNIELANFTERLLVNYFNDDAAFLDYAGGYGLFTRIMRNKGFNFYSTDKFCKNIFAEYYDISETNIKKDFEIVTAFEVLEHLPNPIQGIEDILQYGKNIFFTTELRPTTIEEVQNWWYLIPETGQHIALYTAKSLEFIAKKYNKHFYTDGKWKHLFTEEQLLVNPFTTLDFTKDSFLIKKLRRILFKHDRRFGFSFKERKSLVQHDWDDAKNRIS